MAYEYYELILISTTGGFVRNVIGFLKAKLKHGEGFSPGKFATALIWGTLVGTSLPYIHANILSLEPFQIILIAVAGTVLIDELVQAIFMRKNSPK